MLPYSDIKLNRGLVNVACTLSNTDLKIPTTTEEYRYPSHGKGYPTKNNVEIKLLSKFQAHNDSAMYLCFCEREQQQDAYIN